MKTLITIVLVSGFLTPHFAFAQSQEELDQACEDAREKKLEPLRRQKIEECKRDEQNDPEWCEQFSAD